MTERAERERISHEASQSLFRMPHADLRTLLVPKGGDAWLLADLTVDELRRAYRRRVVRESREVYDGLRAWGTADAAIRFRLASDTERVVKELRAVADPLTDFAVQALAGRLFANPAPSRVDAETIIDHALALRTIGERYGKRGIAAARFAVWDYVSVDEFEEQIAEFAEVIDHFTVAGEPLTELLEAALPDWARPLFEGHTHTVTCGNDAYATVADVRVTYGRRAPEPHVDAVVAHVRGADTWVIGRVDERPDLTVGS